MNPHLQYPLKPDEIMRKKKRIRRELLAENGERTPCRIAILGGSTTAPIREIVELFLLDKGIAPIFYESEYNKWYEDACFGNPELDAFRPQIVYIHTSCVNLPLAQIPAGADEATVETLAKAEFTRYQQAWNQLREKTGRGCRLCCLAALLPKMPPLQCAGKWKRETSNLALQTKLGLKAGWRRTPHISRSSGTLNATI